MTTSNNTRKATTIEIQYDALIRAALTANEDSWKSAPKSADPPEKQFHYNDWWMQGLDFNYNALRTLYWSLPEREVL